MNATKRHLQRGQTLIETLVAVFILTIGISTAISLGVYAFNSANSSTLVIVGTSLAREGVEAVKNQRDSNWISDSLNVKNTPIKCAAQGSTSVQPCSENWLNNLNSGTYALDFNTTNSGTYGTILTANPSSYVLRYCPSTQSYISSSAGAPSCFGATQSVYSRKIVLASSQTNNGNAYSLVDTTSGVTYPGFLSAVVTVWWTGTHCPSTSDPSTLPSSCKTTLEMHFTDWQRTFN